MLFKEKLTKSNGSRKIFGENISCNHFFDLTPGNYMLLFPKFALAYPIAWKKSKKVFIKFPARSQLSIRGVQVVL
jgi:hypothetical protein